MVDGGYTGKPFADATKRILNAEVEVAKRTELHTFAVIPKRWVVERSFAWLEKCRRLWKNGKGLINTRLQMVVLAFLTLLLKRVQASFTNPVPKANPQSGWLELGAGWCSVPSPVLRGLRDVSPVTTHPK